MSRPSGQPVSDRPRRIAWRLGLALVSFALPLMLAELFLRLRGPDDPMPGRQLQISDLFLGWRPKPGSRWLNRMPGRDVEVAFNSEGWRDLEHDPAKPAGTYRILVLGDSFMQANTVALNEKFARLLQTRAEAENRTVEVFCTGVDGYGTLQEYLVYDRFGKALEPDLVLLAFFAANDLSDNAVQPPQGCKRPVLLPGDDSEWEIQPPDYAAIKAAFHQAMARRNAQPKGWLERSALFQRLLRIRARMATGDSDPLLELEHNRCQELPEITRSWDTTRRILRRLRSDPRSAGTKLVVFNVPDYAEIYPRTAKRKLPRQAAADYCLEDPPARRRLRSLLPAEDIAFIDLLPPFREAARAGRTLHPAKDGHWNVAGHVLAADTVWKRIRKDIAAGAEERSK